MRWNMRVLMVALVIAAQVTAGQGRGMGSQTSAEDRREAERSTYMMQTRLHAIRSLDGHKLVLRVYPNPSVDPEKYVTANVPINESAVQLAALKPVCPTVTPLSLVLFLEADQTDPAVAQAFGNSAFATLYQEEPWQLQWYYDIYKPFDTYWTFVDAQGTPMAGAAVEIEITAANSSAVNAVSVPVKRATLDEKGRLTRVLSNGGAFVFTVRHPDYGTALVTREAGSRESSGLYVVPLVPRDSPAAAQAVHGTITDSDGQPVPGAYVQVTPVRPNDAGQARGPRTMPFHSRAVTDANGAFAFCPPVISDDLATIRPAPAGSRYQLTIEPPKSLNLRRSAGRGTLTAVSGSRQTYTLARLSSDTVFHTFAFKLGERELTDLDELNRIMLVLTRDGREWVRLTYGEFKDGFALPSGSLRAEVNLQDRGGLSFPAINLDAESPKHLVFAIPAPTIYRGRIVDGTTGKPMAGVYVTPNGFAGDDPCSWPAQQWQNLQARAERTLTLRAGDPIWGSPYEQVALTNAGGFFELSMASRRDYSLSELAAVAPGYALARVRLSSMGARGTRRGIASVPAAPNAQGVVEVGTIEMLPRERVYFPRFVFEDANGPITDPNRLRSISLSMPGGNARNLQQFLRAREFVPGAYSATGLWDGKYYTFGVVDLTTQRPETVVFKTIGVRATRVTYQGQIVHAVTGEPIWGAIVGGSIIARRWDASRLESRQWDALKALGPNPDPNDPAFTPLRAPSDAPGPEVSGYAITDREGRFRIQVEQSSSFTGNTLWVLARDMVGMRQQLIASIPPDASGQGAVQNRLRFAPDEKGVVTLPVLKVPPAATIRIHPVLPGARPEAGPLMLRLSWRIDPNKVPEWFPDMRTSAATGVSMFPQLPLEPNVDQTMYVPAGVDLTLMMIPTGRQVTFLPLSFGTMKLQPGEVKTFGRVECPKGVQIAVKVVDPNGDPIGGIVVFYGDDLAFSRSSQTDATGVAKLAVAPRSSGRVRVFRMDSEARRQIEESTPYEVAGPEDAGKEFTLRLSASFLQFYRSPPPTRGAMR